MVKGGAADKLLKAGDVFTAVDGAKVTTPDQVVKAVGTHKPGETVRLTVERKGKSLDVPVVTRADPKDKTDPARRHHDRRDLPVPDQDQQQRRPQIGGPSAGTMFALAIYDKLTPGSLTGGKKIAGTGEMTPDGTVGPIGGIRQKMAGAADAGRDDLPGARRQLRRGRPTATTTGSSSSRSRRSKDAISSLEKLAKDPDAKVPSCS